MSANLRGLVVDDQREECTLRHTQEPADSEKTAEIVRGDNQNGADTESKHHAREHDVRSEFLAEQAEEWCGENVWDEENTENQIVLISLEVKGIFGECKIL